MPWEYFNPLPHLSKYTSFEQLLSKKDKEEIDNLCKKIREMWTSEPMKPIERLVGSIMGMEIDRVPCTVFGPMFKTLREIGGNFIDYYKNPVLNIKTALLTILKYNLEVGAAYNPIDMNQSDVFGTKWEFLENSLPKVTEWAVKEGFREIIEKDLPDPRKSEALKWQIETTNFLNKKLGDLNSFAFVYAVGPYYMYNSCLRGPKHGFYDIKKNPELAVKAFDKLHDYIVDLLRYLMEKTNTPSWTLVDSLTSPSFTPPHWYEKFCAPYQKRLVEDLAPAPGTIAGGGQGQTDFTPLLDRFAEMGFTGFMFGPPTDLRKMKKISDEKGIYIMHWAVPAPMMRYGTPQQIEAYVKECIKIAAPRKRYMLGSDLADHDTPDENVHIIKQSVLKYGKYPLQFE
ncbi:MAG: uroporphyrinogen decarboxylase family protein [Candidatus Jordarchaeaceae archaeon]